MEETTPAVHCAIEIEPDELEAARFTADHLRTAALLLHTQGFVILKRALPAALVQSARDGFTRIFQDCVASRQGDGWYQVAAQTQAVFWERNFRWRIFPKLRAPFDNPLLVANPFASELLGTFLGDDYYCKFVSSDTCLKGATIQSPHRELGPGRMWVPRALVVNIPLGPCGLENGPLEIWTGGSHLWNNAVLEKFDWNDDVQDGRNPWMEWFATLFPSRRVVLEPGDILIRDPGLLHRGTVNDTDEPRTMLTLCYFRRGESHDYGRAEYNLDHSIWEKLAPAAKRLFAHEFESPSVAPSASLTEPRPLVSVLVTLMRHRGSVRESLRSWTAGQTVSRRQIELVVLSDGTDSAAEDGAREVLGPADRLIRLDASNEMELYHAAATHARGEWLIFTEPHCIADPGCVEALLAHAEREKLDGCCVRTLAVEDDQWIGRIEARMYLEDAATWTQEGDWRKFTKRGFLLRRSAYEAVGGLEYRYGWFAETAIAARLQARGCRMGFAPDALIRHQNATELSELTEYVTQYRRQEMLFREEHPGVLPGPVAPTTAGAIRGDARMARVLARCVRRTWRDALRLRTFKSRRKLGATWGLAWTVLHAWITAHFSPSLDRIVSRIRLGSTHLRLRLPGSGDEARYRAFKELWQRAGDCAVFDLQQKQGLQFRPLAPVSIEETCHPGELSGDHFWGFHQPEWLQGKSFRWSKPLACLEVRAHRSILEICLDLGAVRPISRNEVKLFWNGRLAKSDAARSTSGRFLFLVPEKYFTESATQILTIVCRAVPGRLSKDSRRLGLPVFAITFRSANHNAGSIPHEKSLLKLEA
jgi:ectoine hydroxylase-related dioxygenase (phytanoyl-CoA dioxygenase family)